MRIHNRSPFRRGAVNYRVEAQDGEAEVYVYDEIGFLGVDAERFSRDLAGVDAETIHLRLNSPGGNVFDGEAIYEALRRHPARVVAHIDGLAASMASGIALAGDEIEIASGGFIMIHDPWSIIMGPADVMRKEADLLDKVGDSLAKRYAARLEMSVEDVRGFMASETWWNAEEAVEVGFADRIAGDDAAAAASASFDLSMFANTPDRLRHRQAAPEPGRKELEAALRDAGLSRKKAKAVLADGYEGLRDAGPDKTAAQCDAGDGGLDELLGPLIQRFR